MITDEQVPDLWRLLASLWKRRLLIIAVGGLTVAIFGCAAFLMTPVYRSAAILAPADAGGDGLSSAMGSIGSLASVVGISMGGLRENRIEEALAVLRSREFSERFIRDLNLMPVLFEKDWDSERNTWRVSPEKQPSLADGYKAFDDIRSAARDRNTGLVRVQIDWKEPNLAANWVNELVKRLNETMRVRAIGRTSAYIKYLQAELSATAEFETRNAIDRLMESQINERMLANVTEEYAFRVVDRALAADPKAPVKPKKLLMLLLGCFVGAILGVCTALVANWFADAQRLSQNTRSDRERTIS